MSPLTELMLLLPFLVELEGNVPPFARDAGVGDGVTADDMLENGLAAAEKSPKDDACVLVIGTWKRWCRLTIDAYLLRGWSCTAVNHGFDEFWTYIET